MIQRGGLDVFPRLVAGEHVRDQKRGTLRSGNAELDAFSGANDLKNAKTGATGARMAKKAADSRSA